MLKIGLIALMLTVPVYGQNGGLCIDEHGTITDCTSSKPVQGSGSAPTLKTRPNVIVLTIEEQDAISEMTEDVKEAEDLLAKAHQYQQGMMDLIYEVEGIDKSTTSQWQVMDGKYLVRTGGNGSYGSYYWTTPNIGTYLTSPATNECCTLDNNNVTR